MIIAIAFLRLLTGCTEQYDVFPGKEQPEAGSVVLYLPNATRALTDLTEDEKEQYADLTEKEQKVEDLDVFIFPADDGISALCVFHQRYEWDTDVIDNTTINPYINLGAKGQFEVDKKYKVYVLANCSQATQTELDKFLPVDGNALPLRNLQGLVQTDADIYRAATDEKTFLMDGTASLTDHGDDATPPDYVESIVMNDGKLTELTNLYVSLRRAASKMTVSLGHENKVRFPDVDWSPETNETDKPIFSYSLTNLRSDTYVVDPLNDVLPAVPSFVQSGQITLTTESIVEETLNFSTYSYSHDWSGSASTFENGSYLVVNVPIFYSENGFDDSFDPSNLTWTHEGDVWETTYKDNLVRYYPANYYKIPMGKDSKLKRNTHYVIRGTITQAGSTSPEKPVELQEIPFETVNWINVDIDVDGDSGIKYLYVNKNAYELRNQAIDNTLMFASSHSVTVEVYEASYIDKTGKTNYLYQNGVKTGSIEISTSVDNDYQGHITLNSPVPENNLIRTIVLKVNNTAGLTESVTITQYPLDYIQYKEGLYSYWTGENFSNYDYCYPYWNQYYYVGVSLNMENGTWTPTTEGGTFQSKYYPGSTPLKAYKINNGNFTPGDELSTLLDHRMYHIQITSTSEDYTLARPKLDENGHTDASPENAKIVSPSFMINSQLGAKSGEVATDPKYLRNVHEYASHYAEVYEKDGKHYVYDDWRVPTAAEISIIIKFQGTDAHPSEAMYVVMNGSSYWSASGIVENPNYPDAWPNNVRLVRDIFNKEDLQGKLVDEIFEDKNGYEETIH